MGLLSKLETGLTTLLTIWAWAMLAVLLTNYFTRLVVRYSEARGIIPKAGVYNHDDIITVRTPIRFLTILVNDGIDTIKLFAYKTTLWMNASIQFFLLNENRGLASAKEHSRSRSNCQLVAVKEVYLLRHGQSVWNLIFNESSLLEFPFRLIMAILAEALLYCDHDSLFLDSPLSSVGLAQCNGLKKWVDANGDGKLSCGDHEDRALFAKIMNGQSPAVFATSNLRRTISTLLNSLGTDMMSSSKDLNVYILSDLQEGTRNVDSFSISDDIKMSVSTLEKAFSATSEVYNKPTFISVYNNGNKTISTTVKERQTAFVRWLFESSVNIEQELPVVVSCHSLYARNLFRRFLPIDHISKKNKIQNCGAVKVSFQKWKDVNQEIFYTIDERNVIPIYKGFH